MRIKKATIENIAKFALGYFGKNEILSNKQTDWIGRWTVDSGVTFLDDEKKAIMEAALRIAQEEIKSPEIPEYRTDVRVPNFYMVLPIAVLKQMFMAMHRRKSRSDMSTEDVGNYALVMQVLKVKGVDVEKLIKRFDAGEYGIRDDDWVDSIEEQEQVVP